MKRIFILSFALIMFAVGKSFAVPLSGTYLVPGPGYGSLKDIIDSLNAFGVSGPVTVRLTANQTAPSGGYVVGSAILNPTLSAANTLTFVGWTAPAIASKTITAQTGSGNQDAIFTIRGANYVTVNSFDLVDPATNTTATTMMERGFAVVKFNKDTGTKKASFLNCNITLNNTNTTAASGVAPLGSVGIFIGNCTFLSTTQLGLAFSEDGTNDGTFVSNCTIKNVNHGIYMQGIPVIADGTSYNDKNCTFVGNTIENFTHHGIYISYSNGDLVNGNKINNTASGGTAPTANSLFGIRYSNDKPFTLQTNANWDCTNNKINLSINTSGTYTATGIYTQINGTGSTFIENDTVEITSIGISAEVNGIFSQNRLGSQRIASNVIRNFTTQTTNIQPVRGMFVGGFNVTTGLGISTSTGPFDVYPTTPTVVSNTISDFNVCSGGASSLFYCYAINEENIAPNITTNYTNNRISNINIIGNSAGFVGIGGVYTRPTGDKKTTNISGTIANNISMLGATNTTAVLFFRNLGPVYSSTTLPNNHTVNYTKNKVSNIKSVLGYATVYAIDFGLSASILNDTVININSDSVQAFGALCGIQTNATKSISIKGCHFNGITNKSNGTSAFAAAIQIQPGSATGGITNSVNIAENLIQNVSSTDLLGSAFAINSTGGNAATFSITNNIISDIVAAQNPTSFNSCVGINLLNSGTNNVFYNTVKMVSSATTATGYGATALRYNPAGTNLIQNNILHVNVLAGTNNNVSAIRGGSGSPSAPPSLTGFTASSNIYYTPTGSNNFLYVDGTTNTSLANGYHTSGLTANSTRNIVNDTFFNSECDRSSYHNFMKTSGTIVRESKTFTENNLPGTSGVFAPSGLSFAESGATDVAVSVDLKLDPRPFGSSDIGALEFSGTVRPQMLITITSSTGYDTACTFNLPTLTATIPSFFNRVSYQWYRDTNKIVGATTRTFMVTPLSGNYIIKVYDSATGCEYPSAPYRMTIVPPPPAQITYYDSLTFCETSAIVLQANKGYNYTYRWMRNSTFMPGETDDHLVVDKSGDYMLEVNTPLGCPSYSLPIRVKVYPLPKPTIVYGGPGKLSTQKYFTYQWYKNNVKIDSFSISRDYYTLYTGDGAYSVEVTDSNGCTAKSDVYLFAASIDENAVSSSIKIYPNPVVNELNINSPIEVNAKLSDVTGRVVLEQAKATKLETSALSEGMYLLTLTDKEGKLIKVVKINKTR